MNIDESFVPEQKRPMAGACHHQWRKQDGPYVLAQLCDLCKLFRYKSSATADWEYRAPIPFGRVQED